MKYLETSYLDTQERKKLEEKGLFCYDLRHSDFGGEVACIEKSVLVNRCGSLITNEKIPLGDKYPNDFADYETFIKNNENVNTIEELLFSNKEKQKIEFTNDKGKTIKYLDKVLKEAIYHGGDGGGAYFTNEEALLESLNELLKHLKLSDICKISNDKYGMIQLTEILPKEKLEENRRNRKNKTKEREER